MSDSVSQHCPNCEAQAAEIERLEDQVQRYWDIIGERAPK